MIPPHKLKELLPPKNTQKSLSDRKNAERSSAVGIMKGRGRLPLTTTWASMPIQEAPEAGAFKTFTAPSVLPGRH